MCQRQLICGGSPTSACNHVLGLVQILVGSVGDGVAASTGTSSVAWNLLGAIGITETPYKPSPRFKFLAVGLAYFLLHQIVVKKTDNIDPKEVQNKNQGLPILRITANSAPDKW